VKQELFVGKTVIGGREDGGSRRLPVMQSLVAMDVVAMETVAKDLRATNLVAKRLVAMVTVRPLIKACLLRLYGLISDFSHNVIGAADEQIVPNFRWMKRVLERCGGWKVLKRVLRGCGVDKGSGEGGGGRGVVLR